MIHVHVYISEEIARWTGWVCTYLVPIGAVLLLWLGSEDISSHMTASYSCILHVLVRGLYISCLSGLPSYSYMASVLCTCISM